MQGPKSKHRSFSRLCFSLRCALTGVCFVSSSFAGYCIPRQVIALTLQWESSPECLKKPTWLHPDMISGLCLEGVGDPSERVVPLRVYKRTWGERTLDYGHLSPDDFPKWIKKSGRYPLFSATDIRTNSGNVVGPVHRVDMPDDDNTSAGGTAFHFHNWFDDFKILRNKYTTFAHSDKGFLNNFTLSTNSDMDVMVRCARGLPNSANPRNDVVAYYEQGLKKTKGPKPIFFQDAQYRRERHELVVKIVSDDEAKYGSSYDKDGAWLGNGKEDVPI